MALPGRKPPQAGDTPRHRVEPVHDWTDVPDVPFAGPWPVDLPEGRVIVTKDGPIDVDLQPETRAWWETIKTMPHAVLWTESDWQFAKATAIVADMGFCGGVGAMTELRQREKTLGTTHEARMGLRIRYVDPVGGEKAGKLAEVRTIDSVTDL